MICISPNIQKKMVLTERIDLTCIELEGVHTVIPIHDLENTPPIPLKEIIESWDTDYETELNLEQ